MSIRYWPIVLPLLVAAAVCAAPLDLPCPRSQAITGIGWGTTCVYHPATGRYLLSVTVHDKLGDWGPYESTQLWGPWRTVAYGTDFPPWTYSPAEKDRPAYLHSFPAPWISPDGKTLWCVFDRGDHFNLAQCTLHLGP